MAKESMIIAEALDERDFLRKKILESIRKVQLVTVKRKKDPKTKDGKDPEVFSDKAKADYQSIIDMISRYRRINAAIIDSNAKTMITLRSGITMSRADAISKRKELRSINEDLEYLLLDTMAKQITSSQKEFAMLTKRADDATEAYKNNISSKDKELTPKEVEAAEALTKAFTENEYPEIIDPIGIQEQYETRNDQYNVLVKELDTAIKVSNANTVIEI